jgi:hypothetical protein
MKNCKKKFITEFLMVKTSKINLVEAISFSCFPELTATLYLSLSLSLFLSFSLSFSVVKAASCPEAITSADSMFFSSDHVCYGQETEFTNFSII